MERRRSLIVVVVALLTLVLAPLASTKAQTVPIDHWDKMLAQAIKELDEATREPMDDEETAEAFAQALNADAAEVSAEPSDRQGRILKALHTLSLVAAHGGRARGHASFVLGAFFLGSGLAFDAPALAPTALQAHPLAFSEHLGGYGGYNVGFDWAVALLADSGPAQRSAAVRRSAIDVPTALHHFIAAAKHGHLTSAGLVGLLGAITSRADLPGSSPAPGAGPDPQAFATAALDALLLDSAASPSGWTSLIPGALGVLPAQVSSQVALGGRNFFGSDATAQSCPAAAMHLEAAAGHLIRTAIDPHTPAPQLKLAPDFVRLEAEYNGRQGKGGSSASGLNGEEDIVSYHKFYADSGDAESQVTLGIVYLLGLYGYPQDYGKAREYLALAAEERTDSNGQKIPGDPRAKSALGYIYHTGAGVDVDMKTAFTYYRAAARDNDGYALAQLGRLYLQGLGLPSASAREAFKYFTKAAEAQNAEGQTQLGLLYLHGLGTGRDVSKAHNYFARAAQQGNLLALYSVAQLHHSGLAGAKNCKAAVALYKKLIESHLLLPVMQRAYAYYSQGHYSHALVLYDLLAGLGLEVAQSNAAWLYEMRLGLYLPDLLLTNDAKAPEKPLLDRQAVLSAFGVPRTADAAPATERSAQHVQALALAHSLHLYRLAAHQGSADAHLKLGDYYYYGLDGDERTVDLNKSAAFYWVASDLHNAQAAFNLGWMYQRGLGSLPKDLHLAKRNYDQAYSISSEAFVPTRLALAGLALQYAWITPLSTIYADVFPGGAPVRWDTLLMIGTTRHS